MKNKQTLEVHGVPVVNKKAYWRNPTTSPCPSCASVFTHPQKNRTPPASVGRMFTEQAIERWWGKWQSHWSLGVWWSTGEFSLHGPISQRNVHSKDSWRRQEIYTESSGPKEGCAYPAQAPPHAVRWVKCHRAFFYFDAASPRLSLAS